MTRGWQHNAKCPRCGGEVPASTPFSLWLRRLPYPYSSDNYDNQNLDYIWHHYRQHWFITIEEKRFGIRPRREQQDTHDMVAQLLAAASGSQVQTVWRGVRSKQYRGHYTVIFEKTTPDDSAWILINGLKTKKEGLLQLLLSGSLSNVSEEVA